MRRIVAVLAALILLAVAGTIGFRQLASASVSPGQDGIVVPTARVARGSLTLTVHMQGDLRASRQMTLTAPAVGGSLRILTAVDTGTAVRKDEPILEFDPADQQYALEQAESELLEAEQEIIKRRAEIKAQDGEDQVALLTAQFDVRRATLDAALEPTLIAAAEMQIRQAAVREATRHLARLEQDISERSTTSKASLAVLEERRTRARLAAERARQNMLNLVIRAPMDGVVGLRENQDAAGGIFFGGMSLPAYRAGDTVSSGRVVADVFDVSSMEIRAQVNEQERANVAIGQTAQVDSDAVPGVALTATVSAVAGLGRNDSRGGPLRQFEVTLDLKNPDPRLRPGTSVRLVIQGQAIDNVLLLPRQALFEIDGKPMVLARIDGTAGFTARPVKVLHRTESRIAIEGIPEGTEVALIDPGAAPSPASPAPAGGKRP